MPRKMHFLMPYDIFDIFELLELDRIGKWSAALCLCSSSTTWPHRALFTSFLSFLTCSLRVSESSRTLTLVWAPKHTSVL